MKTYLARLPEDVRSLIDAAGAVAEARRETAYCVGGFVRDLILGVKNFDLDIIVEGNGIAFSHDYARRLQGKLTAHHRFGTATVYLKHHVKVDIATARKEFYPQPAHLPVVQAGTLRDDLFRRDFTINAIALRISGAGFGQVIDIFGGRDDLENGTLRVLHPVSFIDDPTRILRGIRFEQRFDFVFERYTHTLMLAALEKSMLDLVEPQRLRDELILLLKEDSPVKVMRRLAAVTGFLFISPKLKPTPALMRTLAAIEHRLAWFTKHASCPRPLDTWLIYFMGLVGELPVSDVHAVCRRFVFRKADEKRIVSSGDVCGRALAALQHKKMQRSEIFHILEPLSYEVIILMLARTDSALVVGRIREFLACSNGTTISVSGHDLGAYGLKPGPRYQRILKMVLNAKLDGKLTDKASELRFARKIAQQEMNRKE
jgi:tRNA nucleotidyltransferase (CCA-adding enzyme)